MIFYLTGTAKEKTDETIIMDVNGVGYQVYVTYPAYKSIELGKGPITIYIYHHIREDNQLLFGFESKEDRELFLCITSVSGVGPKVGLKILSQLDRPHLMSAIVNEDLVSLTGVSGVGKKMAERLIVELKDKIPTIAATHSIEITDTSITSKNGIDNDLQVALETLGYSKDEIRRAYQAAGQDIKPDEPIESSIKVLLKAL